MCSLVTIKLQGDWKNVSIWIASGGRTPTSGICPVALFTSKRVSLWTNIFAFYSLSHSLESYSFNYYFSFWFFFKVLPERQHVFCNWRRWEILVYVNTLASVWSLWYGIRGSGARQAQDLRLTPSLGHQTPGFASWRDQSQKTLFSHTHTRARTPCQGLHLLFSDHGAIISVYSLVTWLMYCRDDLLSELELIPPQTRFKKKYRTRLGEHASTCSW